MGNLARSWCVEVEEGILAHMEKSERAGSFESFFEAEYLRLFRALLVLTGGDAFDAEDCAQEAMLRVCERWDRVKKMDSPTGYLYRTALNVHRSRLRRLAVRARRVLRASERDNIERVEAHDEIVRALTMLPPGQREALVLVEWLGFDSEAAGKAMGIKASSVRGHLSRAKATLREKWSDDDD